jgi:hypothetical protein
MNTTTAPTTTENTAQPTDMEKLTALFTEFGIGFKPNDLTENSIVCEKGDAKIGGYNGFTAQFDFDENGKFKEMSVWE